MFNQGQVFVKLFLTFKSIEYIYTGTNLLHWLVDVISCNEKIFSAERLLVF